MTEVFRLCEDYMTRGAGLDPVAAGMVGLSEAFGAATDYGPDGCAAREELIATTRWRPGSAWALTSTWPRPTSGAGPNSPGSRPRWRSRRTRSARARAWTRPPRCYTRPST